MGGRKGDKQNSKVIWPGFSTAPLPRHVAKVGRNDLCPCGSEKKYKDCHEKQGSSYLEKLAQQAEDERVKKIRQEMKEKGVPWYKRFLFRG